MTESHTKRTFENQPALNLKVRLEPARLPALDKLTPQVYDRLNAKQREELLEKLIEFLKNF
jgi:hypothetical protein